MNWWGVLFIAIGSYALGVITSAAWVWITLRRGYNELPQKNP